MAIFNLMQGYIRLDNDGFYNKTFDFDRSALPTYYIKLNTSSLCLAPLNVGFFVNIWNSPTILLFRIAEPLYDCLSPKSIGIFIVKTFNNLSFYTNTVGTLNIFKDSIRV